MVLTETQRKRWTREELEALSLPPMEPKIREAEMKLWMEPEILDDLELGDDGLWVAMHGAEIAATDPSLEKLFRKLDHFRKEDVLVFHVPPDDVIDIF